MISIIVSSYNTDYFNAFENSVKNTIGIPFEIIKIWNPGLYSITEAYNRGAKESNFDVLVFVHEDVEFDTFNWGKYLLNDLDREKCGVVGVAGSTYCSSFPIGWWQLNTECRVHFIQDSLVKNPITYELSKAEPVVLLDGVFLGMKRSVYDEFKFEERLSGFHGYDVNFSFRVSRSYTNYVTNSFFLRHFSSGNADRVWFDQLLISRELLANDYLQMKNSHSKLEGYAMFCFYKDLMKFSFSKKENWRLVWKYFIFRNIKIKGVVVFIYYYLFKNGLEC